MINLRSSPPNESQRYAAQLQQDVAGIGRYSPERVLWLNASRGTYIGGPVVEAHVEIIYPLPDIRDRVLKEDPVEVIFGE